jgi:thioredoxin-like negative regulator of GroEL
MPERFAVVIGLAAAVMVAVLAIRFWNLRRVKQLRHAAPLWDALGETPDGRRTLVAFSTRSCAACHTAQAPAVKAVEQQLGASELRVIHVDASRQPEVARTFGVLTVPSTVVLEPEGRIVAINQGFAPSRRLIEQLQRAPATV